MEKIVWTRVFVSLKCVRHTHRCIRKNPPIRRMVFYRFSLFSRFVLPGTKKSFSGSILLKKFIPFYTHQDVSIFSAILSKNIKMKWNSVYFLSPLLSLSLFFSLPNKKRHRIKRERAVKATNKNARNSISSFFKLS